MAMAHNRVADTATLLLTATDEISARTVIDAYRKVVSRVVSSYFTKLPSAGDHPVFRLG